MVLITNAWRNKVIELLANEKLDSGHIEAATTPLEGKESKYAEVRKLIDKEELTPEEYVAYFKMLQERQRIY